MWPRLVAAGIGIWLMFAPAVLGYSGSLPSKVDRTLGPLAASLAIIAMAQVLRPVRWWILPIGASQVVLALVLAYPMGGKVNGALCGAALVALSFLGGQVDKRFGNGWKALWR